MKRTSKLASVTRRRFLRQTGLTLAAAGSTPLLSAPFVSRALADNKSLAIVQWSHFVPAYDTWFDKFAKDWGDENKIAVTVDHIPVQDVPARAAAEASAGAGHDLFGFNGSGGAHLYRKFFIDVGDLVRDTEKKYGKVSPSSAGSSATTRTTRPGPPSPTSTSISRACIKRACGMRSGCCRIRGTICASAAPS